MLHCASSPHPAFQSNILQDWDQFFHLWQCFSLIFFCLPWGDEVVWALLFNFLHSYSTGQILSSSRIWKHSGRSFYQCFYRCHARDFSIKRKKGDVQETMSSEKLPNPRNWKLQVFMCTGAKQLKEEKERNNFLELRSFHPQQVWSTWAKE